MLLKIATLTLEMYCALHFHFHFHFIFDSVGLIIAHVYPIKIVFQKKFTELYPISNLLVLVANILSDTVYNTSIKGY
jgi:hypothetical protein